MLEEEKKLYFLRPEFHRGGNVTVRLGDKWFGYEGPVALYSSESDGEVGKAEIVHTEKKKFSEITLSDIRAEHDPSCLTIDGLREAMFQAYDRDFEEDSEVTLVTFVV